jgi:hypothetical protein
MTAGPTENSPTRRAKVRIPPWLFGGDILAFAREAGLHLHPVDASTFRWEIETFENYENRSPSLCDLEHIAGPKMSPAWKILADLPPTGLSPPIDYATLDAEKQRLTVTSTSFTDLASWVKTSTIGVSDQDVTSAVQGAYESLRELQIEEGGFAFPDLSVHFIRFAESLVP